MSTTSTAVADHTTTRAMEMLTNGYDISTVAAALGVSVGRISQIAAEPAFAAELADKKFEKLQAHTTRDAKIDSIEDALLDKLQKSLPMVYKPQELTAIWSKINAGKRRGSQATPTGQGAQQIVNLVLPTTVIQKFTTNINNQVVSAGAQDLVTLAPGSLAALAASHTQARIEQNVKSLLDTQSEKHYDISTEIETRSGPASVGNS